MNKDRRCITIIDGYRFWNPKIILIIIENKSYCKYGTSSIVSLNRLPISILIEYYLHNIVYVLTKYKIVRKIKLINQLYLMSKDVDLEQKL